MARLEDPQTNGTAAASAAATATAAAERRLSPGAAVVRKRVTATTTTTVVSSDGTTVVQRTETVKKEETTVGDGRVVSEESTVETLVERAGAAAVSDDVAAAVSAAAAAATSSASASLPPDEPVAIRTVALPSGDVLEGRWGADRVAFAASSSLPRYDETEEEAAAHDALEVAIAEAKARAGRAQQQSNNSTKGAGGGGKKGGGGGMGGLRRSLSRSSHHGAGAANGKGAGGAHSAASAPPAPPPPPDLPKNPVPGTSWTPISGTKFSVRTGPNYKKHGRKAPSAESLYEAVAVRCYRSDRRTAKVADVLPLPLKEMYGGKESVELPDLGGGKRFVPDVLVYHVELPYESPNMFKPKDDGAGGEIVFYLKPSQRFLDELSGLRPITPAARHFVHWCQRADADLDVRSQFKTMALVRNLDRHNLGWLNPYNGKPVLITESGRARRGVTAEGLRFLEMSANVHKWAFLAKKGFVSLIPKFRDMRIDVGWTIEAAADVDLPECMLGAVGMNYIDESKVGRMERDMQEKREGAGNAEVAPAAAGRGGAPKTDKARTSTKSGKGQGA